MPITLAVDFGSTYTKVVAIDCDDELLLGVAQSPTTVGEGVMIGLECALARLDATSGVKRGDITRSVASSSAAGGLRMVAIGLVPDLMAEAARRAAPGAGAKVLRAFAYELSRRFDELHACSRHDPARHHAASATSSSGTHPRLPQRHLQATVVETVRRWTRSRPSGQAVSTAP